MRLIQALAVFLAVLPMSTHAASIDLALEGYELEGASYVVSGTAAISSLFTGFSAIDFLSSSTLSAFLPSDASSYSLYFGLDVFGVDSISGSGARAVASSTDTLEVLFTETIGTGVFSAFSAVLVTFKDPDLDILNGFTSTGMNSLSVSLLSETPPVPLPAGGLLLLTCVGLLASLRRKKTGPELSTHNQKTTVAA